MENALKRRYCCYIQSGQFLNEKLEIKGRNSIIDLNYMGSAEFEFGALPSSTRRILTNIEFYDIFTFPEYVNQDGEEMKVYAPVIFIDSITEHVHNLAAGKIRPKEYCSLSACVKGVEQLDHADFWWDILNDFYIFFGDEKAQIVIEAEQVMLEKNRDVIGEIDSDKLARYYLKTCHDLSDESIEFLKSKKSTILKKMKNYIHNDK